ncbi:ABZJ_00895 family protein [Mesorhizobium sp. M0833]|uniref:ABZJ_00895 family protein n=1 Tax=unclassified Mesorhizobium TaxID=325217 RepID=UPI003336A650
MDVGQARSVNVWPYVGVYSLVMMGLTVIFMGISIMFPSLPDSFGNATGIAIAFGSTSFVSYKFIRKNLRLFNRDEYWKITLFSSLTSCLLSLILGGLAFAAGTIPGGDAIPLFVWVFVLLFGGLVVFGINAAGYSSRMGKNFLKAELARQARINTEIFR